MAAETFHFAGFKDAEDFRLCPETHIGDFVQKERAAVRQLKAALSPLVRAGIRAALVPEKFVFHKLIRHRRAIQRNERFLRARALRMDSLGDELFAAPVFAGNQHGKFACGDAANLRTEIQHRRTLAHHLVLGPNFRFEHLVFLRETRYLQKRFNTGKDFINANRLGDIPLRAELHRLHSGFNIALC